MPDNEELELTEEQNNDYAPEGHTCRTDWTVKDFVTPHYMNEMGRVINEKIIPNDDPEENETPEALTVARIDGKLYQISGGLKIEDAVITELHIGEGLEFDSTTNTIKVSDEILNYIHGQTTLSMTLVNQTEGGSIFDFNSLHRIKLKYTATGDLVKLQNVYVCWDNAGVKTRISANLSPITNYTSEDLVLTGDFANEIHIDKVYKFYLEYDIDGVTNKSNEVVISPRNVIYYGLSGLWDINSISSLTQSLHSPSTDYTQGLVFDGFETGVSTYAIIITKTAFSKYYLDGQSQMITPLQKIKDLTENGVTYYVFSLTEQAYPFTRMETGETLRVDLIK